MRNQWLISRMIALLLLLSLSMAACIQPIAAPPTMSTNTPITVFDAFNAAVNAHDVDKALSFFADDATAQFPNQPPPNQFTGSAEIRTWLESDAKDNAQVVLEAIKTAGNTVSATAKVTADSLPPDLILVGTVEVTVVDGKITSFTYTLNDETMAKLQAFSPPAPVEFVRRADNIGRIQVFDTEGNFLGQWSETGADNPPLGGEISGLAIDRLDNIYVADAATPSIYVFHPR
jgi:hypothetical protein